MRGFDMAGGGCGVPAANAYAVNVTVVPTEILGYLTLWSAGGAMPFVSALNSWDGTIVSNAAMVPASSDSINVYATHSTHVILDVVGCVAP